jgi:hypothetical protein
MKNPTGDRDKKKSYFTAIPQSSFTGLPELCPKCPFNAKIYHYIDN